MCVCVCVCVCAYEMAIHTRLKDSSTLTYFLANTVESLVTNALILIYSYTAQNNKENEWIEPLSLLVTDAVAVVLLLLL